MKNTARIHRFEDLIAWQKLKNLSLLIYRITGKDPFKKDFNLKNQIRKASVSVMSNIAEGFDRYSTKEFMYFLSIARGSVAEIRSQIHLAEELGYINNTEATSIVDLCRETGLIIGGLRKSLEKKLNQN
jgi:four helix bundle protein